MRTELLTQTRLVANSVNSERLQALSGTETDLNSPDYLRLKKQLGAMSDVNPKYRFIYLFGQKADGTIFFFVDDQPVGHKDESPAGMVYEDASDELRRVFATGRDATEGPVSDQWGTFISAFVPILIPGTSTAAAVIGMDIDASVWNLEIAARSAIPVGLMILLLIGIVVAIAANRRVKSSAAPVQQRLLAPMMAIVLLLTSGAAGIAWYQHQQKITDAFTTLISEVRRDLHNTLNLQAQGLAATTQTIAATPTVQQALRDKDSRKLLACWQSVFETLRRENNLSHFYFFDINRICLLRIHKPEKYGDLINRFTALKAERTGKTASGIELGPLNTFTLRVVQPVFENGKLVGYVELGKEIEDILQTAHNRPGLELAVMVHKDQLQQQTWQESMRLYGREANWNRLPNSAIIYASQGHLPDVFTPFIVCNPAAGILSALLGFIFVLLRRTDAGIYVQQAEIQEKKESLSATLRSISDGVIACDALGNVVSLNVAAETLTGWSTDAAMGRSIAEIFQIINTETRQEDKIQVSRALRENRIIAHVDHTVLVAHDGMEYHISSTCAPIHDTSGDVIGAVLVFRNITDEYQQRKHLRESEEKHRLLFEQSVSAIAIHEVVLDTEGKPVDYIFLSVNPAFKTQTGLQTADITGKRVTEVLPGIEKTPLFEIYGKVVITGESTSFEHYSEQLGRHYFINAYQMGEEVLND